MSQYLDEPERLLDVPADGEVVDGDLPQLALLVDHEQAAEGDPGILLESQKRHKYEGDKSVQAGPKMGPLVRPIYFEYGRPYERTALYFHFKQYGKCNRNDKI